ncbi:Uncharacterised protein [Mesomycoplasma dispar]|uniref:Uncharacterized protein n=1 Tax=Mesomycoplasma dispar TaxID=86660 RepID=A0AAJ5NSR0_9BACT|nr:outer membrane protein-P95 [Mesomycoplasma dispar]AJR12451.1 hypothetical protein MDIS_03795 [Mesomycoplasma dispar]VEU62619.1 Uncharacterised protein [Mesomycoplasma dispar]
MKIVKKIQKTKRLSRKSKILLGLGISSSFLAVLSVSLAASYGFALIKKKSYETTVDDLNKLTSKINALSFNAQKISPFSTYATLKNDWKTIKNSEKNGEFFDFYTLEYKRLQPYKLPNGIWAEFTKIEPDDANQQFNVEFVLKSYNGSRIIKSDIKTDKVAINPNSTFFLENFYQALQIDLKNVTPFSRTDKDKKSPSIWLATDFLNEINVEPTADDAIKKIREFFNFDFDSVLKNKNFSIKHNNSLVFPYKIEILKNSDNTWLKPSQLNSDFLEIQGKISFTDEAKKVFPKNFNTSITKNFNFLLYDSSKNESAFANPKFFINIPKLVELKVEKFSSENPEGKTDSSQKSISWVYNYLKYKEKSTLKTSDEAKKALNSLLKSDLKLDFGEYSDLEQKIKQKFDYQILVDKIRFDADGESSLIYIPFEISYPLDEKKQNKLKTETKILLRNFKNSTSQPSSVFDSKAFTTIPVVNLKYIKDKNQNDSNEVYQSFESVSKVELERLLAANQHEQIYDILTDSSKFNITFPEREILDSWISSYDFPSVEEFSKRTLVAKTLENGTETQPFFKNNQEFLFFTKKILNLPKEEAKKYLDILFKALTKEEEKKAEKSTDESQKSAEPGGDSTTNSAVTTQSVAVKVRKFQETEAQSPQNSSQENGQNGTVQNGRSDSSPAKPADSESSESTQGDQKTNQESDSAPEENTKATEFNDKIVANLRSQYLVSAFKDLISKIESLKVDPEKKNQELNTENFTDLFIESYKNSDLVSQFDNFGEKLNYNIVFVAGQDSEKFSEDEKINSPNPNSSGSDSQKNAENEGNSDESSPSDSNSGTGNKSAESADGSTGNQTEQSQDGTTQNVLVKNKVTLFQNGDTSGGDNSGQVGNSSDAQQTGPNSETKPEQETETFKLGYYYTFTSGNGNKIVFRTPVNSINLKVFLAEKPGITLEKLSYNVLNFPQKLLTLQLADSNFATADTINKSVEDILKTEFNNQDKDFEKTTESFKKLFGNKTFVKIYPLLSGNGLVYKKDSVFKDKFGNIKIRFTVKDLTPEEQKKIVLPNILETEKPQNEGEATEPSPAAPVAPAAPAPAAPPSTPAAPSGSGSTTSQLKNELEKFTPQEKEAKYPLVFTVIKSNKQQIRN